MGIVTWERDENIAEMQTHVKCWQDRTMEGRSLEQLSARQTRQKQKWTHFRVKQTTTLDCVQASMAHVSKVIVAQV